MLFLLLSAIILSLPIVQTKIAQHLTEKLNKQYKTDIAVDEAAVTIFGGVKLKKVFIKDYRKDTLIYVKSIITNILDVKKIVAGDLLFGDLRLDGLVVNMKNYKGAKDTNLDKFIDAFDDGTKSEKPFLMHAKRVFITNSRFLLTDENRKIPKDLDIKQLNTAFDNFQILGPNVDIAIKKMSFLDHRGIFVENLSSDFKYTKKSIDLNNLDFNTKESVYKGKIMMSYDRDKGDFSNFNNKVQFDVKIDTASIASNDIYHFYKEIGKDKRFRIQSKIKGTLNNLFFTKLNLIDENKSQIVGNVNFKNIFGKKDEPFYMKGNFDRVASKYENLTKLLPNVLGKKLPSALKKLGQFTITGNTEISATSISANVYMTSALGNIKSDLNIGNIDNIDDANYNGNIILDKFNLGKFLNQNNLGKVSLNLDIAGRGFVQKYLNTTFKGTVNNLFYNGYDYSNITLNGGFQKSNFQGKVTVKDPNLNMDFDGILNLKQKTKVYNFETNIGFANLKNLNFVNEAVSNFKGAISVNAAGTTLDDFDGNVRFVNANYQNAKAEYSFDDFEIHSSFDSKRVRTITLKSSDIVEGQVVGKFKFGLLQKMLQNALGSLYTNYQPNAIQKGQFLNFDFKIYKKVIDIFYPGIDIGDQTKINGSINSDTNDFKLDFSSPKIEAYKNYFNNISIKIDNKNPLYNTFIALDSVRTTTYKIKDFRLINVTQNDTLFFRTEFKGGDKSKDFYNLNLYHTINSQNKNVVGIKKSEVKFKENLWFLNENESNDNKIIFDKKLQNFTVENISMSHDNQSINLFGDFQGQTNKNLNLKFKNVDLKQITPSLDNFLFDGLVNGIVNLKQNQSIYQPTSALQIQQLTINNNLLGDMNLSIKGDDDLQNFLIQSNIENNNVNHFNAAGKLSIADNHTNIDLDMDFDRFNLGILSTIGGSTISNIKGFASGKARINGNVDNFDMNGRLYIDAAGLKIPYLNTVYQFNNQSIVDVTRDKFIFNNVFLEDTAYATKGKMTGNISHKNFDDWALNLSIESDNIIALNTEDTEDAAYYGKAFINGKAEIFGSVDALTINVNASSNKGTDIKIPVNDSENIGENDYLHFVTAKEKEDLQKGITGNKNEAGLNLNFDLDINRNADIEVILNRDSKHGMKGNGLGTLQLAINTLGKFEMYGDFYILKGKYDFKYGGLIDKSFDVKKGGTIVWNGDPLKAELNIEAVYDKISTNPGVLLENPSFNQQVPTVVTIGITGNLSRPESDFYIDFPNVSSVLKSEIQTKLEDKQVRQKQALVLLASKSFLSQEGLNQTALVYNNLFEKAGHLFDDLFQDDDSKIKLAVAYNQAERTQTDTQANSRFDVNISTQISDKITINGKVGVPIGGVNETAIVGNVEIQYRVNDDGTMNLKVFNRENEINYIGEGIGYTQGIGISYEVDFNTFSELVNKIFNKKLAKLQEDTTPSKNKNSADTDVKINAVLPIDNKKKKN